MNVSQHEEEDCLTFIRLKMYNFIDNIMFYADLNSISYMYVNIHVMRLNLNVIILRNLDYVLLSIQFEHVIVKRLEPFLFCTIYAIIVVCITLPNHCMLAALIINH